MTNNNHRAFLNYSPNMKLSTNPKILLRSYVMVRIYSAALHRFCRCLFDTYPFLTGKKAQITIRMVDYQPQDVLFSSLHNPSSTSNPEQLSVLDLLESGENEGEGEGGLGARCLTALSLFSLSKYNVVSLFVDDSMAFFPPPSSSTPLFWQYKDMDDFSLSAAASSPPSTPRTPPSFSSSAPPNIAPSSSSSSSSLFSFLSPFRGEKSTPRKIEKPSHRMDDLTGLRNKEQKFVCFFFSYSPKLYRGYSGSKTRH